MKGIPMTFNHRLRTFCQNKKDHLSVGLDVDMDKMPGFLLDFEAPILEFNKSIIHATSDVVAAYKLNMAFYEAYSVQGWRSLKKTLDLIPEGVLKIADAKRGDVAHSSEKYRDAFFKELNVDAITLNPLLGYDSVAPFLEDETRGVFLLCLTSNDGARDFQSFSDGKEMLFEKIARKAVEWNKNNNVGLVVGATKAEYLHRVRQIAPDLPILLPGVGAQGGDLKASVAGARDASGGGFLINSSRGILYDADNFEFAQTARKKAIALRDAINQTKADV